MKSTIISEALTAALGTLDYAEAQLRESNSAPGSNTYEFVQIAEARAEIAGVAAKIPCDYIVEVSASSDGSSPKLEEAFLGPKQPPETPEKIVMQEQGGRPRTLNAYVEADGPSPRPALQIWRAGALSSRVFKPSAEQLHDLSNWAIDAARWLEHMEEEKSNG